MNKVELVDAIAKNTGLSKKDTEAAVKSFIEVVTKELSKGHEVQDEGIVKGSRSTADRIWYIRSWKARSPHWTQPQDWRNNQDRRCKDTEVQGW